MSFLERAIRSGIRKGIGDTVAFAIPAIAAGAALIFILHKYAEKSKLSVPDPDIPKVVEIPEVKETAVEEKTPIVVMTRYSDAEIERLLALLPEIALFTARELEVLREILRGRKQSEVAHYLGIEVSTVKDFYKKIYTKLNVSNKDGLFLKIAEIPQI